MVVVGEDFDNRVESGDSLWASHVHIVLLFDSGGFILGVFVSSDDNNEK